jgi:nicotinate phosphoribosyltransferase
MDRPIITSMLDLDFYKFTMALLAWKQYRYVPVRYGFTNRSKGVHLGLELDLGELREQLEHVRTLRPTKTELHYLRGTNEYGGRMFPEEFLEFFADNQVPDFELEQIGDDIRLEFPGDWPKAIWWETLALSIINELYFRKQMAGLSRFEQEAVMAEGIRRLHGKIKVLKGRPDITFSDFGTRRRFSKEWQWRVIEALTEELPGSFLGTSNVEAAMNFGLLPMGTSAHEKDMIMTGIMHGNDDEIRESLNVTMDDWWNLFGQGLSIALTDTFGTNYFFKAMTQQHAQDWKGLRHDSGAPIPFSNKAIKFYEGHGVDPREKLLVFSDGLDLPTMIKIADHCAEKIKHSYGWGTNLTNDLGFRALSLVIKAIEANGHGLVKLSDNLAKATGSPEDVEHFKRIFGHKVTTREECVY